MLGLADNCRQSWPLRQFVHYVKGKAEAALLWLRLEVSMIGSSDVEGSLSVLQNCERQI